MGEAACGGLSDGRWAWFTMRMVKEMTQGCGAYLRAL